MNPTRRLVLAASATLLAAPALIRVARAEDADPRIPPRSVGSATAKNVVEEWFSFTCPHCAAFARETYPDIRAKLVDTGRVRYVFREFPRDRLDLAAAEVARSLPVSRYEPFVLALLAGQQQWAFTKEADPKEELAKMAALAGMPRAAFDKAIDDKALEEALLGQQSEAEQKYNIDSTPTFIVNGTAHPGELSFEQFSAMLVA
jgi:protein-disulfide isomerase